MSILEDDGIELGRRQHHRFAVEIDAEVTTPVGRLAAITRDLSRGGVCFELGTPLAVGASFGISLSLVLGENTFSEPLKLEAVVIWCTATDRGHQIGAAFTGLNQETRNYLQLFLNVLAEGVHLDSPESQEEGREEEEDEEKGLFA